MEPVVVRVAPKKWMRMRQGCREDDGAQACGSALTLAANRPHAWGMKPFAHLATGRRALAGTLGLSFLSWLAPAAPYLELSPMVGHTTASETRIWAQSSASARLAVRVGARPELEDSRTVDGPTLEADAGFMGEVLITHLHPSSRYYYCLQLDGRDAMPPPYPSFSTAPPDAQPGRLRVAFVSCVGYHGYDSTAGFADMARTNFDLLLMLGDNVYSNTNDPIIQRRFFFDQRNMSGWRGLSPHVPIYAIWDDHDYGPDNSDGTLPGKERALRTFQQVWANPSYGEPDNPGVYFKFTRGDVEFFMLDGRYHRDPNLATNLAHKTMLGDRQLAWFKRELAASKATLKILVSGGEWQAHGTEDSWRSFKRERDEIFQVIQDHAIQGVLLLSGDRHYTGAYQVEGKWIEVTTGPIGSAPATARNAPESFLNFSSTKGHFYCIYDLDTAATPPQITLEVYRVGDGLAERRAFTWDEVRGMTKIKLLPPAPKDDKEKAKAK
jgi:alkaline phosphatase D